MITLDEIWQRLLDETGQFLYEDLPELTYDPQKLKKFVEQVLGIYNRYSPVERSFNISVTNLSYDFTNHAYGVPEWISRVVLVSFPYSIWFTDAFVSQNRNLRLPRSAPWAYRKPILYVSANGDYDVTAVYFHKVSEDGSGNYYIETLDQTDDLFFKLLVAKFLQRIGRARRAFTLNELPVTSDAADLVSEGRELEQEALEQLGELGKWYLAWG